MPLAIPVPLALGRFKRLPQRNAAVQANPYVVSYLLDPDSIPDHQPPHVALHSRDEAAYVADTLADAFEATDGALEWLARQPRRSPSRPGGRRRRR